MEKRVALLLIHRAQAYILLTATLDDVQAIVKQISEFPLAGQLNSILRRATTLFNEQLPATRTRKGNKLYQRTIPKDFDSLLEIIEGRRINRLKIKDQKLATILPDQVKELRNDSRKTQNNDKIGETEGNSEDHTKEETRQAKEVELEHLSKTHESSHKDEIPQDESQESVDEKRSYTDEMLALGKNASYYLNSMKHIIEK